MGDQERRWGGGDGKDEVQIRALSGRDCCEAWEFRTRLVGAFFGWIAVATEAVKPRVPSAVSAGSSLRRRFSSQRAIGFP